MQNYDTKPKKTKHLHIRMTAETRTALDILAEKHKISASAVVDMLIAREVKEIQNGVKVQEWISVKDRLPDEKVNSIVHYKHAYCKNDDYWAIGICFYDGNKFQIDWAYKVTHWMPLPKPPKGE